MLGGLRALQGDRVISRFRSQKTGLLLAYLASHKDRTHPREELIELLWPEMRPELSRNSLSQSLSSLRHQLEPPGADPGTILIADRWNVSLNPESCSTDVGEFLTAFVAAQNARVRGDSNAEAARLHECVEFYYGEFLAGYYDAWCLAQRDALSAQFFNAIFAIVAIKENSGELDSALEFALRAVAADPDSEEANVHAIRIYAALQQPQKALKQYRVLERALEKTLGIRPSVKTRELVRDLLQQQDIEPPAIAKPKTAAKVPVAKALEPEPPSYSHEVSKRFPLQLTSFIGRESERREILIALKEGARLVTLTGPGGVGKSRLSVAVARDLAEYFEGRVYFVPLAEMNSGEQIPVAILNSLEIPASPHQEPSQQIASSIGIKPALLVLDNFEQLLSPGDNSAETIQRLLSASPAMCILVSSRKKLGISGEREQQIAPFPLPHESLPLAEMSASPGVKLFADRAQSVRPDFQLTKNNASSVRSLCARLDGLPLAIELAAARAHVLSPAQILERLQDNFDLLVSRGRDPTSRHHTLRNTLDWSFQMLPAELQRCLSGLTVFRGGWTLDAAEAVLDDPLMIDHLADLREFSLITAHETEGSIRFGMLETIRSYAKSQQTSEQRERHAQFFVALAAEAEPKLTGPRQGEWLARLEAEMDNYRATLDWCLQQSNAEIGLKLGADLWRFWHLRSFVAEGRAWLERIIAPLNAVVHPGLRGRVLNGLGRLAYLQGDYRVAENAHIEALELCRAAADLDGEALAINALGSIDYEEGRYWEAKRRFEDALALRRKLGDHFGIGNGLNWLGIVHTAECNYAGAKSVLDESLAIRREIGDRSGIARSLNSLGIIARHESQFEIARKLFEESLAIQQELGDVRAQAGILSNLALIASSLGDRVKAQEMFERALGSHEEVGDKWGIATVHTNIGNLLRTAGEYSRARQQLANGLRIRREISNAWGIANSLAAIGSLDLAEGRADRAIRLFAAATKIREEIGSPIPHSERAEFEIELKKAREFIGDERFRIEWSSGSALSIEEAFAFASQAF